MQLLLRMLAVVLGRSWRSLAAAAAAAVVAAAAAAAVVAAAAAAADCQLVVAVSGLSL